MNLLVTNNFLIEFKKLNTIQRKIFLESVKKLEKITSIQRNIDKRCLLIFQKLFEAYQYYSTKKRVECNNNMQEIIDAWDIVFLLKSQVFRLFLLLKINLSIQF